MAWTKLKTAMVIGVAVLLTAGTTTTLALRHHQKPSAGAIQVDAWAFKGYATPEAAFQSSVWAMRQGDVQQYLASTTPEYQQHFRQNELKHQTEQQLADGAKRTTVTAIRFFEIVSSEQVPDGSVMLHIRSALGPAHVPLKNVDGEWKLADEPKPDRAPQAVKRP